MLISLSFCSFLVISQYCCVVTCQTCGFIGGRGLVVWCLGATVDVQRRRRRILVVELPLYEQGLGCCVHILEETFGFWHHFKLWVTSFNKIYGVVGFFSVHYQIE